MNMGLNNDKSKGLKLLATIYSILILTNKYI